MQPLPTDPTIFLQEVTALLRQTFGAASELVHHTIHLRKEDYVVMRAQMRHPTLDLILKIAGPRATIACPFEQNEFLNQCIAAQTNLFMPPIFAADSSYQRWPWRYLIRANVPGVEWAKLRDRLRVEEVADLHWQLGDAVAQLHNITWPAFGEFAPNGEIQGDHSYREALRERATRTIRNHALCARFLAVLDDHAEVLHGVGEAALCHEDLHRHNLLFRQEQSGWKLATILDFDKAWAGCPESDLARLELWEGMTSESYWAAYQARRAISPSYPSRRPIFQLMWCLEYARQSEKHLADTNQLCQQLGLPEIEHFEV